MNVLPAVVPCDASDLVCGEVMDGGIGFGMPVFGALGGGGGGKDLEWEGESLGG